MRLGAVALMVSGYDAGIAFYVGTLGFSLVEDRDEGRKRWVTVQPPGGGPMLVLAVGTDQAPRRVTYFLHTDDFARDHAMMRAAGVTFEEPPRTEAYGTVAVWRDPFGNRWDLFEPSSPLASAPSDRAPARGEVSEGA